MHLNVLKFPSYKALPNFHVTMKLTACIAYEQTDENFANEHYET